MIEAWFRWWHGSGPTIGPDYDGCLCKWCRGRPLEERTFLIGVGITVASAFGLVWLVCPWICR